MKSIISLVIYFISMSFAALAQSDVQIDVKTEKGIVTVSKMPDGRDMILLSALCWDEITLGTKYSSANLSFSGCVTLCIEISNKKSGLCRSGIGFGCSMYDYPPVSKQSPKLVNNQDRFCSVTITKVAGAIKMIFNDRVDWRNLEKASE